MTGLLASVDGRPIPELLEEYSEELEELRRRLGEGEEDLILLRLLIQAVGSVDDAEITALKGRADRQTYKAVLEKARRGEALPQEAKIRSHLCFGRWDYPSGPRAGWPPLLLTRSGKCDLAAVMDSCTQEEMIEYILWTRERILMDVLHMTRESGRMILMASINDLTDASLFTSREPRFFEALGQVSTVGEGVSPLLGKKHIFVNAGIIFTAIFALASLILPQRVLDKVAFMTVEELREALRVPPEEFPDFLGGTCKVPRTSPLYIPDDGSEPQPANLEVD